MATMGKSGGLLLIWRKDLNIYIHSFSLHHIIFAVSLSFSFLIWRGAGVYGWPEAHLKYHTWELLNHICSLGNLPLLCFGDFNEILLCTEKRGGRASITNSMLAFQEILDAQQLRDLGFSGCRFTWNSGRSGDDLICECLDRFLCSSS